MASETQGRTDGTMAPRFSIIDSTTPMLSFGEALGIYKQAGAVAIGITEGSIGDVQQDVERLAASGLGLTGCFLATASILPSIPGLTPEEGVGHAELDTAAARVESMVNSIRRLAPLRPEYFYALTGPQGAYDPDEARSLVLDGLRDLAAAAAETGAKLVLEVFHETLHAWSYLHTIPEGVSLVEGSGAANVGIAVDVWHLGTGSGMLEDLRTHAGHIVSMHIDDWREPTRSWADRVLPGDGIADIPGMLGALDAGGFDGWYELEVISDDGRLGNDFPDSLWKRDPLEFVSDGRAKFFDAWAARRTGS